MSYGIPRGHLSSLSFVVVIALCTVVRADQPPRNPWNASGGPARTH